MGAYADPAACSGPLGHAWSHEGHLTPAMDIQMDSLEKVRSPLPLSFSPFPFPYSFPSSLLPFLLTIFFLQSYDKNPRLSSLNTKCPNRVTCLSTGLPAQLSCMGVLEPLGSWVLLEAFLFPSFPPLSLLPFPSPNTGHGHYKQRPPEGRQTQLTEHRSPSLSPHRQEQDNIFLSTNGPCFF